MDPIRGCDGAGWRHGDPAGLQAARCDRRAWHRGRSGRALAAIHRDRDAGHSPDPQPVHPAQPRGGRRPEGGQATGHGCRQCRTYGSGMVAKCPDEYARYAYQSAPYEMVDVTRKIQAICERYGVPLAAAALQFSMLDPNVDVTVVGMSKPERVQHTIELATIEIPQALWDEVAELPTFDDDPEL